MQNDKERYCERFNMTAQEFQDYKDSKKTRIIWYIFGMFIVTLFNDRIIGYIILTFLLFYSYYHNAKCEEQWIKDGSVRKEDL